jgi:hypothetical protein
MYLVIGDAEIAFSDVNTAGGSNMGYGWRCWYITETSNFFMASYLSHLESFKCVCEGRDKKYNCGYLTESSLPIKLFDREERWGFHYLDFRYCNCIITMTF